MARVALRVALAVALLGGAPVAVAQPASPAPLRNLVDDQLFGRSPTAEGVHAHEGEIGKEELDAKKRDLS